MLAMMPFVMFDPMYFLILAPAMLLAGWAQWRVKSAYAAAKEFRPRSGMSGAEAASRILSAHGLTGVTIEPVQGSLSDHYDPKSKTLRLSEEVYGGRTLSAVGIAAHEAGHAIQDGYGYAPLKFRNGIVPLASIGSNMSVGLLIVGMLLAARRVPGAHGPIQWGMGEYLMVTGIILFSVVVLFQMVNLPVEFDASRRARKVLVANGIITEAEDGPVGKVLNAAALTYVAATLTAVLTLVYYLMRSGLLGGSRRD
jgi:uncharacterized protein